MRRRRRRDKESTHRLERDSESDTTKERHREFLIQEESGLGGS